MFGQAVVDSRLRYWVLAAVFGVLSVVLGAIAIDKAVRQSDSSRAERTVAAAPPVDPPATAPSRPNGRSTTSRPTVLQDRPYVRRNAGEEEVFAGPKTSGSTPRPDTAPAPAGPDYLSLATLIASLLSDVGAFLLAVTSFLSAVVSVVSLFRGRRDSRA